MQLSRGSITEPPADIEHKKPHNFENNSQKRLNINTNKPEKEKNYGKIRIN